MHKRPAIQYVSQLPPSRVCLLVDHAHPFVIFTQITGPGTLGLNMAPHDGYTSIWARACAQDAEVAKRWNDVSKSDPSTTERSWL